MQNKFKAHAPILSIVLSMLAVGYTFAANVVVIPLAAEPGISGYEIVKQDHITPISEGQVVIVNALCPEGKKVLGGGSAVTRGTEIVSSNPFESNGRSGWSVTRKELVFTLFSIRMSTYAICAKVT